MKSTALLFVGMIVLGCSYDNVTVDRVSYSASPVVPAEDECVPTETTETILPASGISSAVHVLCSDCDDGHCEDLGEPCARYGTQCDIGGVPGVCVACCNGLSGELHCSPIN